MTADRMMPVDFFDNGDLRFPVIDSGPVLGETVVLLHGFPQDTSAFDEVVPRLHAQGVRTLVPHQRGYAASARPARRRDYALRLLVDDVVALADAAGLETFDVVGHDWGGVVGWALADRLPDRVRTFTSLSMPHPAAFAEAMLRSGQALMSAYVALFQLPVLPEAVLRRTLRKNLMRSSLPAAYADRYSASWDGEALTGALNWYRALPFADRPSVGNISVPTTYVWGRRDFALGRAAAERTAAHVSGDYRFVALDAGHWLPETRPAEVAAAVLARIRSGR